MKKRVLLSLLAMASFVGASAYDKDQYVYTNLAKVKTTAPNAVTNGDFTNAFAGFDNGTDGGAVSNEAWEIVEAAGPNQENVLQCNKSASGYELSRVWKVDGDLNGGGLYVISYMVCGPALSVIGDVKGDAGYYGFFVNQDGTRATVGRQVSDGGGFGEEWTVINDTVLLNADDYLVMYFDRVAEGTRFANISINKCEEVFDDRLATNKLDYLNGLINSGNFTNGKEILDQNMPLIEGYLSGEYGDPDSPDDMQLCLDYIDETIEAYLDANAASIVSAFTHWYNSTKYQKATQIGDWVFTGGRIFHCNNVYEDEDKARIEHQIGGGFDLPAASGTVTKEAVGVFGPGKYLIKMDVKGYTMISKRSTNGYNYHPNVNYNVSEIALFGGDQRLVLDSVPTQRYRTFYMFYDVPEGSTENKFGWDFTLAAEQVGKLWGGQLEFTHFDIRKVGLSKADLDHLNLIAKIATAQNSLKVMLDSAKVVATKTDIYKWGMAQLNDSIKAVDAIYQASLLKVDADGNEVAVDDATDANLPTELDNAMKQVRKGFQNVYGYCESVLALQAALPEHEALIASEDYAVITGAPRTNYETAINDAKNRLATYSTLDDDATIQAEILVYQELLANLNATREKFMMGNVSFEKPIEIAITNGDFSSSLTGWTSTYVNSSSEAFKVETGKQAEGFESGNKARVWRGQTASPQSQLKQEVNVSNAGLYAFNANAYAFNEYTAYSFVEASEGGPMVITTKDEVADTLFSNSQVKLMFGPAGAPDSTYVWSRLVEWPTSKTNVNGYMAGAYVVFYNKAAEGEEAVEFGLCSHGQVDGKGANAFAMGDAEVEYYGDAATAIADINKSCQVVQAEAQALLDSYVNGGVANADQAGMPNIASRLARRLASAKELNGATNAKELTALVNATFFVAELAEQLSGVITGINTVNSDVVKMNIAKGVYNLNGVKVANSIQGLNNLPAGLYIFNNKKYVVK
ncbi:MAG: hypothetical protein ACI4BA_05180 [Prevotella sp.]